MILDKDFDDIKLEDFNALLEDEEPEGTRIDYKDLLSIVTGDDKKEFLADISSFANTSGGYLIIGIHEEGGIPVELGGFEVDESEDALKLRLENLIRDGLEPQIYGVRIKTFVMETGKLVVIIRIPRSWSLPHWVSLGGHKKFYARNSAGKYQLDIQGLRQLFALSDLAGERIRGFRAERIALVQANNTPVKMDENAAKTMLHIIPFSFSNSSLTFDVSSIDVYRKIPIPMLGRKEALNGRYNFDGVLVWTGESTHSVPQYTQLFRSGAIETVDGRYLRSDRRIVSQPYETALRQIVKDAIELQCGLGVQPPFLIMLTLIGVYGFRMDAAYQFGFLPDADDPTSHPIDRDILIIPESIIYDVNYDIDVVMRPIFDAVWNAASFPRSRNYDEEGKWREK